MSSSPAAGLEDVISKKEVLDVLIAAMDSYDNNVTVNEQATFALSKILVTNGEGFAYIDRS